MSEMCPRDRIIMALKHGVPDRVPIMDFIYSRNLFEEVIGKRPVYYRAEDIMKCAERIGFDAVSIPFGNFSEIDYSYSDNKHIKGEWGTVYYHDINISWPDDAPILFPLHDRGDWRNYTLPDIQREGRLNEIKTALKISKENKLAVFGEIRGPFSATWDLFGFERFCFLLYDDPDLIDEVMTACTDYFIRAAQIMIKEGVDIILFADDYGSSQGPLMSIQHFRKHVWPQVKRMVQSLKCLGTHIIMHSDGDLRMLLGDLVSLGIDAYHPMERQAHMDIQTIKKKYGNRITLIGNIDNKVVLVRGTVDEVIAQTKECLQIAGPGGSYILASDHSLHDDIPNENVFAMIETAKRYGKYPIKIK